MRRSCNIAVAEVINMGKVKKTILCLSMCDRVESDPEQIKFMITDRILGKEEMANLGVHEGFSGVVATAKLDKTREQEKEFFENMIKSLGEGIEEHYREGLMENCTSSNIIRLLDRLFHNHMETTWCPNVLDRIEEMIKKEEIKLRALGTDPSLIETVDVWNEVESCLNTDLILRSVHDAVNKSLESITPSAAVMDVKFDGPVACTTEKAKLMVEFATAVELSCKMFTPSSTSSTGGTASSELQNIVAKAIIENIEEVFRKESNKELMIQRFVYFKDLLTDAIRKYIFDSNATSEDQNYFALTASYTLSQLSCRLTRNYRELWENLQYQANCIFSMRAMKVILSLSEFITKISNETKVQEATKVAGDGNKVILQETIEVAELRKVISGRLDDLKKKRENVQNLNTFIKTKV